MPPSAPLSLSHVILSLFLSLSNSFPVSSSSVSNNPPNIVYILIDDLGFSDLGYTNSNPNVTFPATPTIDNLQAAANTRTLRNYYIEPVCSPSRSTIQTGLYPLHHGVVNWLKPEDAHGLPTNLTTMAEHLNDLGYVSHCVGKWHLGFHKDEYTPTFRGYDTFLGFYGGGEDYTTHVEGDGYDFRFDREAYCGVKNCSAVLSENVLNRYSTDVFGERAVDVITSHDPSEEPLFMYLAFQGGEALRGANRTRGIPIVALVSNPKIPNVHARRFAPRSPLWGGGSSLLLPRPQHRNTSRTETDVCRHVNGCGRRDR